MKKTLSTSFGLFGLALVAIVGWYAWYTHQIQAKLDQFVADAQKQKLVRVTFNVTAPKETPADQVLYLSGSAPALGSWDAAGMPLTRGDDGKYHGSAEVMSGVEYGFKVTRGTWGTVETDAKDEEAPDHILKAAGEENVDVAVANWRDGGKTVPNRVTMTGDIRLHKKFRSNVLVNERSPDRTLIVYLPPDYEANAQQRYPVLYMQDGQNLFDAATSFAGIEWRMDEAAQNLISSKTIPPMIIVGIYNGMQQRADEFTPPSMASGDEKAKGDDYAKFVVDEVKPFIDKTYRTEPDKSHTGIGGGSMGGLIALHVAKQSPQMFGQIVLFSPWLRIGDKKLIESDLGDGAFLKGTRVYVEMGSAGGTLYPSKDPIADAKEFDAFLQKAGLKADADYKYVDLPGLAHNEPAWATRVEPMLTWVYGNNSASTQPTAMAERRSEY
jgi:predicted alpha/beta superfamily hydrolase